METQKIDAEVWHFEFCMTATVKVCLNRSISVWFMDNLNPERGVHRVYYHGPLSGLSDGHIGRKALADWLTSGENCPRNQRAVEHIETWIVARWLNHFAAK